MPVQPDPRADVVRELPMTEIIDRLPLDGLRLEAGEMVGPCPVCGGRDRFAINLKKRLWLCRHCAPSGGDGIELARHVLGCDFKAALSHLVGEVEAALDPVEVQRRKARAKAAQEKAEREARKYRDWAVRQAKDVWRSAVSWRGTLAEEYLAARGIDLSRLGREFACFRFLPDHPYIKKIGRRRETLHSGPALIAAIQKPDRRFGAVHQTWLDPANVGEKAKIKHPVSGEALNSKLVLGSKKGGAIRLTGNLAGSVMVMGEGIETTGSALAAGVIDGASYWAGVDLGNMAGKMLREKGARYSGKPDLSDPDAWAPPATVRRLIFITDGDSEPKMTRAKLLSGLRRASARSPEIRCQLINLADGFDLNDVLQGKNK